jgi:hypothetical protein
MYPIQTFEYQGRCQELEKPQRKFVNTSSYHEFFDIFSGNSMSHPALDGRAQISVVVGAPQAQHGAPLFASGAPTSKSSTGHSG